jgi:hypothetical protein
MVTNLARPSERPVAFYNQRGTAEQSIKEGKGPIKWPVCHAAPSPPTRSAFSSMRSPTISATSTTSFAALPDQVHPLQRAQLMVAFSVGTEIIQVRHIALRLGLDTALDNALKALAESQSVIAIERLAVVDQVLASRLVANPAALRARGLILALSEALIQHASYFDAGAPG